MHIMFDQDEYEVISETRPCSTCNGDLTKCNGMCNGMASMGLRRRSLPEIAEIKIAKRRQEEDEILAKADAIRAARERVKNG